MATTPNYGWVTPAPTDFVTALPADFETFADAVDADLAGLLGGTTGQYLVKDSNSDHDFSWGTISAGGMTELATGSLSGGSLSLQSISGSYKDLVLVLRDFSPAISAAFTGTVNNTTGIYATRDISDTGATDSAVNDTNIALFGGNNVDPNDYNNFLYIKFLDYANTTSHKYAENRSVIRANGDLYYGFQQFNLIRTTSAISRIDITVGNASTFDAGTYVLYGVS